MFQQRMLVSFFIFFSCNNNPVDNDNNPPCFDCFDFRLTDFELIWSPDGKTIDMQKLHSSAFHSILGCHSHVFLQNGLNHLDKLKYNFLSGFT